jgi:ABC-type multidrug transport system fused ATPase/permease subunit
MRLENRSQWRELFINVPAAASLLLVAIHQGVIASSSYFLIKLIDAFQNGTTYHSYLILFLCAMTFPYLPGSASLLALQIWINRAHRRFTERVAVAAFGLTGRYREKDLQLRVESVVARNSFSVVKEYLEFCHWFADFFLNSVLSILVLGYLLPGNLVLGYGTSLIICGAIIFLLRNTVTRMSSRVENELIDYGAILARAWENTTLGNRYNHGVWQEERDLLAAKYYRSANKLAGFKQLGNLLLAAASLGPTVYLVLRVLDNDGLDAALVAAVVVNLTRIFHILSSLSALVYQVLDWSSMNARMQVLFDIEDSLKEAKSPSTIAIEGILLNGMPVEDFEVLLGMFKQKKYGRFTIKGANGSGKSTLLQALKKRLLCDAIYLPAQQGGLSWRTDFHNLSTGQRKLSQLHEISRSKDVKYLLLDEWDANLDAVNTVSCDLALDEISKNRVVVEVRH